MTAARLLVEAERDAVQIGRLSDLFPELDVAGAYAIQLENIQRRVSAGAAVVGYKVGLTNAAMQQLLGVYEPDFGHLLDDVTYSDGISLVAARYCQPRVEPEICFRLAETLHGPGVTVSDVLAATDAVAPALEIVDSRILDWKIKLVDTVADNGSAAAMVVGAFQPLDGLPDLASMTAELFVDGELIGSGAGEVVLGHPAAAVAWLANALAGWGTGLPAGHLVLPGSMTTAPFVHAGHRVEARFDALGTVSARFT
ncbi:2-keto-4-pentenoate hydratase [Fodinicola feengrottensis]|uniref:2-keto-4-pentenoate hydratase n=1 Tax=Fodinicola feengrottensis TaxID=435914 RepID=A0ABP4TK82_9ACTN|nr:fumarylacetoacetate hydrolase family protein [Fodinicola feengrottensis]